MRKQILPGTNTLLLCQASMILILERYLAEKLDVETKVHSVRQTEWKENNVFEIVFSGKSEATQKPQAEN